MNPIDALRAYADPDRAEQKRAYHKTDREVLGLVNAEIHGVAKSLRTTPEGDLETADVFWQSGIFEARIAAGSMLTRGKLSSELDEAYWQATTGYAAEFDGWAIADHMAGAAHKRILNSANRYMELEPWTQSEHLWTKRAAMVYTLPFARLKTPSELQIGARETVLSWAAEYSSDEEWFIQKSVGWWLRELSKQNPDRVIKFLGDYGDRMKPFARKEAGKYL